MKTSLIDLARHLKHKLFNHRDLWTIALYMVPNESDLFEIEIRQPFAFIGERGIRLSKRYQSTVADPFLISYDDQVFLFYEVQTDFGVGEIHAVSVNENGVNKDYGCVLKENYHLSYPQVFFLDSAFWMIPESAADKKVWLYRASSFPGKWEKYRVLVDEELVDTSLVVKGDGVYLLGTSRLPELKMFYAPDLHQVFVDTELSISKDNTVVRNAGMPARISGKLYRFAQNCQNYYGENVNILEITDMTERSYSETLVVRDLFKNKLPWMARGCHHVCIIPYKDKFILAVDGKRPDRLINNLSLAVLEVWARNR